MPFLLRKIRKNRWYSIEDLPWLSSQDLQADALGDMATTNNTLSLYRIDDNRSNLSRTAAALAANCDNVANFDYILFNEEIIKDIGIKSNTTKGNTSDEQVNNCHIDLIELSAVKLVSLAKKALDNGEVKRFLKKDITEFLIEGFQNNYIDQTKVKLKQEEITKLIKMNKKSPE